MKKLHSQYPFNFKGQYFDIFQEIIESLYEIPRTGWFDRRIPNPETVGEHVDELISMSEKFFFIPGLSKMLKVHDLPETDKKVGDVRTDKFCPPDHRWSKEEKYQAELEAMTKICPRLGPGGKEVMNLWLEFEEKKTWRAQIANQLDKLQPIMKAVEYELKGYPASAKEFIDNQEEVIIHPILHRLLVKSKKKLNL